MITINIREIRVNTDPVRCALERAENERMVDNPKLSIDKHVRYVKALQKANLFFAGERGKVILADPPDRKISYHVVQVELYKDDFEGDDLRELLEITSLFDSMNIVGDSNGNITLQFMSRDIFTEKQ